MAFRHVSRKQRVEAYRSFYVAMEKSLLFHGLSEALLLVLVVLHRSPQIRRKAVEEELLRLEIVSLDCQ